MTTIQVTIIVDGEEVVGVTGQKKADAVEVGWWEHADQFLASLDPDVVERDALEGSTIDQSGTAAVIDAIRGYLNGDRPIMDDDPVIVKGPES